MHLVEAVSLERGTLEVHSVLSVFARSMRIFWVNCRCSTIFISRVMLSTN